MYNCLTIITQFLKFAKSVFKNRGQKIAPVVVQNKWKIMKKIKTLENALFLFL